MSKSINVPKLRFKEFSGVWEDKLIGQILTVGSGKDYKHLSNGDIPVYGTGGYMLSVNDYLYDGESVGIGRKGTIDKPIFLTGKFWTVDTLFYTHSFKNSVPKFIYSIFQRINWKLYNEASGVPSLSKSTIEKIKIFIPSKHEQEKIASFLISIDTRIEQLTKKEELLQQYKKGVMQKIFNQEIRFKADDGSEFCEWEEKTIDKLPILISDGNYGELYPTSDDFKPNGVPFLRANNIKNLKIDTSDTKYISEEQHSTLTAGHLLTNDILITTRGELGNLALIENEHNGSNINAQICLLRITDTSKLNYLYLLYALDYRDSKKQYKAFETGTALKQLPKGNLKKVKLKVPCLEEQTKIANFLSSTDNKIEQVQKQLNFIKEFKKALLHQMFV